MLCIVLHSFEPKSAPLNLRERDQIFQNILALCIIETCLMHFFKPPAEVFCSSHQEESRLICLGT